ncbi:hypothetical protein ABTA69_20580, partial [Acinetobacter baumannii]
VRQQVDANRRRVGIAQGRSVVHDDPRFPGQLIMDRSFSVVETSGMELTPGCVAKSHYNDLTIADPVVD